MKCFNLPEIAATNFSKALDKNAWAWISITQPEDESVSNEFLDALNVLKIKFWDITQPLDFKGEILYPPNAKDALEIVRFCLLNQDKNIIVNCQAGISRSGAVCRFLQDMMGYEWAESFKVNAIPNACLYKLLVHEYRKIENDNSRFKE